MAYIVKYTKSNSYSFSAKNGKIVDVNCLYETQHLFDGSKILVLKTYNPKSINAGISQTIHFTKESAIQLIEILKKELDI